MTVNQNVIEAARIVEGKESDLAQSLETQFKAIAMKLFPELDWSSNPLEFKVADGKHVNACIYSYEKPPVIVIERGLLDFIENEDELAFVIGHEMGHERIRSTLGYGLGDRVTKTEEASADIISTLRSAKAGYSYHAGINLFKRIANEIKGSSKKDVLGAAYNSALDPHPNDGNRIVAMELSLIHI